jgi:hypothetical protein
MPESGQLAALEPAGGVNYSALTEKRPLVRYCENVVHDACNWLLPADGAEPFCLACRHNRTIPDISVAQNLERWQKMEIAKHRLFYTLIALRLPLQDVLQDPVHGLAFDFLADNPAAETQILTGHDSGLITINLNEADDAIREQLRTAMGEPYRTLLGHFRHEVGHYFWDVLVGGSGKLEECRTIFGDDSIDYAEALKRHYAQGAPANWQDNFISAYATAHPWEDFAETWAHYLHIVDTLETASAFGLRVHPVASKNRALHADIDFDPHKAISIDKLIDAWLPLTFAMNSLNRSMGRADLYPFIVSAAVVRKLQFIHDVIRAGAISGKKSTGPRKPGIFKRLMKAAMPEQPPALPPLPPQPGPPLPEPPPIMDPPNDAPPLPPPGDVPDVPLQVG